TWNNLGFGTYGAVFDNTVHCAASNSDCYFEDIYTFTPDLEGFATGKVLEIKLFNWSRLSFTDIDFTKIALVGNGTEHPFDLGSLLDVDGGLLTFVSVSAPISLIVQGW